MSIHESVAHAAQAAPDAIAVAHEGVRVTWRTFAERVACRATQLHGLGLAPGDRVAVLAANVPEHLEALMAIPWAGLVVVPINTRLAVAEQSFILEHSGAQALCCDTAFVNRAQELVGKVAGIRLQLLSPISRWSTPGDELQERAAFSFAPASPSATGAIFYTGGTTGAPKGVELSHNALAFQCLATAREFHLSRETVFMHTAPLFHLADFASGVGTIFAVGSHLFLPEFSPSAVLDAIEQQGANTVVLVPTMLAAVLDAAAARPGVLGNLRRILYGAAPIAEPLLRRLLKEAPTVGLIQVYGQTEVGGGSTALQPEYHVLDGPLAGKLTSAGLMMAGYAAKIIDEDGNERPLGERGEICISSPSVMTGYWRDPELTTRTLRDGWVHTGDVGFIDVDGFLTIVGRIKDMIITGGENVFAGEVESALMFHPAVVATAVIGVPDEKWGESVHAVVVLKEGQQADAQELIAHCRQLIAPYKCPRTIEYRKALPVSGVGKVRKIDLKHEWQAFQAGGRHV